jgi:hypothetical protein
MRTLQEKYNGVLAGSFSKTQFKRDAATEMPQFVSNVNSFEDTVNILKNKGAITEAKQPQEPKYSTAKPADHVAPDVLDTGIKFELDKKYGTLDVTPEQYEKCREMAIKNLSKDVLYYVKQDSIQLDEPGEKMEKAKLNEGEWKDKGQSQELNKERLANLKAKKAEAEKKGVPAGIIATMDKEIRELEALLHEDAEYDKYVDDLAKERENRHEPAQTDYEKIDADLGEQEESVKQRIVRLVMELLQEDQSPEVKAFATKVKHDLESNESKRIEPYMEVYSIDDLRKKMSQKIGEAAEDINESSEQELYRVHKFLKEKLDKKAVEAGDRMSYFSAEFPLASTFAKDVKEVLQNTVTESEYDSQSKSEGLAELRNILEELGDLSKKAYDILQVYFPTYLRSAEAYGALDFGTSSNRYDTTLESIIDEIQEDDDALSEDQDFTLTPDEREEQEREKFASYSTGKERKALKEMFKKIITKVIND